MSRKVLLEAEHSLGTKSPNWRASDALGHVKGNSNLVALFNMSLRFSDFVPRNSSAAKGLFNNFSTSARWI